MVIDKADKLTLMGNPAFRRFLLDLVQITGIFESSSDGERMAFREGRRSVGLEILRSFDEVAATPSAAGLPADTSIQLLREAVQLTPRNKANGTDDAYGELDVETDAA